MVQIELIDKHKIFEMAVENANMGESFIKNANKSLSGLKVEEQIMLLGFTYARLISKTIPVPKTKIKQMLNSINVNVQKVARELEQSRNISERQIQMIPKTEDARVKLAHQLNAGDFENALETAVSLVDMFTFGGADSYIYRESLEKAKKKYGMEKSA